MRNNERHEQNRTWVWWVTLWGPFAVSGLLIVYLLSTHGHAEALRTTTATLVCAVVGKAAILGGGLESLGASEHSFSRGELLRMVIYAELFVATLATFHIGFLYTIPWLGNRLRQLVPESQALLRQHRWMRRTTALAVIGFMVLPIPATGSLAGSILGRLLGLTKGATFSCLAVGSLIGCGLMYFKAGLIGRWVGDSPALLLVTFAVLAAAIVIVNRRYKKLTAADA